MMASFECLQASACHGIGFVGILALVFNWSGSDDLSNSMIPALLPGHDDLYQEICEIEIKNKFQKNIKRSAELLVINQGSLEIVHLLQPTISSSGH